MSERIQKKGGRYYKKPEREPVLAFSLIPIAIDLLKEVFPKTEDSPSVTTILNALSKPALIGWAAREERRKVAYLAGQLYKKLFQITDEPVSPEKFVEILTEEAGKSAHRQLLEKASSVGTEVHARIEWQLKEELGKEHPPIPPPLTTKQAEHSWQRWQEWRVSVKLKPISIEKRVFSVLFGFGGTLDLLAEMEVDGKEVLVVIDFKTGKAVYAESFLQNVAYRLALKEEGIAADEGYVVRLPKYEDDPEFEAIRVPQNEKLPIVFLALRIVYQWWVEERKKPQPIVVKPAVEGSNSGVDNNS